VVQEPIIEARGLGKIYDKVVELKVHASPDPRVKVTR
jgi:hypothetical protein